MTRCWLADFGHERIESAGYGDRQRPDGFSVVHAVTVRYALGEPDERTGAGLPFLLAAEAVDRAAQNIEGLIGAVMDMSPQAVKSLLSRARTNLKEALQPYLDRGAPISGVANDSTSENNI